jgi:hypothetical protein
MTALLMRELVLGSLVDTFAGEPEFDQQLVERPASADVYLT